jgi:hypothetical protein
MDPNFEIKETIVITRGKFTWLPSLQEVDGRRFIELSKWDRNFVQFATGKCLDFRSGKSSSANVSFFDRLVAERKKETHDAIVETLRTAVNDDHEVAGTGRNSKRRKITWQEVVSSEVMAPKIVNITVDDTCVTVLSSLKSSSIWVELSEANLIFIQSGVSQCLSTRDAGRQWSKSRRASCGIHNAAELVGSPSSAEQHDG